jgi:hypothetical protein
MVDFCEIVKPWVIVFLRLDFLLPEVSRGVVFCKKMLLNPFTSRFVGCPFLGFRETFYLLPIQVLALFPKPSYGCDREPETCASPKGCYSGLQNSGIPDISSTQHSFYPKVLTDRIRS